MASSAVTAIAQSLGCSPIEPKRVDQLAKDTENHVAYILEVANRVRKHRHSKVLTIADIKNALSAKKMKPLVGYHRTFTVKDYELIGSAGGKDVYAVDDEDVSVSAVGRSEIPNYPCEHTFSFHWLAYNGIQLRIGENQDLGESIEPISELVGIPEQLTVPEQEVSIVTTAAPLSREMEDFFRQFVLKEDDPRSLTQHVLRKLENSPDVQDLLPHFMRLIDEYMQSQHTQVMEYAVYLCTAICSNTCINIELYLQNIVSALMAPILIPAFIDAEETITGDDAYALRARAADLLGILLNKYEDKYADMKMRVVQTLITIIFSDESSLTSKSGAVLAFQSIGLDLIKEFLLPHVLPCLQSVREQMESPDARVRMAASRLNSVLMSALASCYHKDILEAKRDKMHIPQMDVETAQLYEDIACHFGYTTFGAFAGH